MAKLLTTCPMGKASPRPAIRQHGLFARLYSVDAVFDFCTCTLTDETTRQRDNVLMLRTEHGIDEDRGID
jgi:hypothetical protein